MTSPDNAPTGKQMPAGRRLYAFCWLAALLLMAAPRFAADAADGDTATTGMDPYWLEDDSATDDDRALLGAVATGNIEKTAQLFARHPEYQTKLLNVSEPGGGRQPGVFVYRLNALHIALRHGNSAAMVAWLLDHGCDPNSHSEWGPPNDDPYCSALVQAIMRRRLDDAQLLLDHGADINAPGYMNTYPALSMLINLQMNLRTYAMDCDTVLWLLDHGADPTVPELGDGSLELPPSRVDTCAGEILLSRVPRNRGYALSPHNPETKVLQAVYPRMPKIPAPIQLLLYLCLVAGLTGWIRRRRHRPRPTAQPLDSHAAIADYRTDPKKAGALLVPSADGASAHPPAATPTPEISDSDIGVYLERLARYQRLRWWTLIPVLSGLLVMLLAFQDPFLKHGDPFGVIRAVAGAFAAFYCATWIPWRWLQVPAWLATAAYALLFGMSQAWTSGYFIYVSMQETWLLAMFILCGIGFLWLTVLSLRLLYLAFLLTRFEFRVRRQVNRHLQNLENTGIALTSGWDQGGR